jgi:hypothetical protein
VVAAAVATPPPRAPSARWRLPLIGGGAVLLIVLVALAARRGGDDRPPPAIDPPPRGAAAPPPAPDEDEGDEPDDPPAPPPSKKPARPSGPRTERWVLQHTTCALGTMPRTSYVTPLGNGMSRITNREGFPETVAIVDDNGDYVVSNGFGRCTGHTDGRRSTQVCANLAGQGCMSIYERRD